MNTTVPILPSNATATEVSFGGAQLDYSSGTALAVAMRAGLPS